MKKAKEVDPHQFVSSENSLLAERSFVSEQDIPSFTNGNNLEWKENVANNTFASQELHAKVCISGLFQSSYGATVLVCLVCKIIY